MKEGATDATLSGYIVVETNYRVYAYTGIYPFSKGAVTGQIASVLQ
jgi:hypothetical protein